MTTLERLRSGQLLGSTRLTLACGLTEFPREIFDLADTLEILDLSGNALRTLPDDLARLHQLRILFCSDNQFTELPAVLGQCPRLTMVGFKANQIHTVSSQALPRGLRWLILTDNRLQALPPEIGQCAQLQKLMLAGNQLQALPPELAACTRLELVRIAANRLTAFPDMLLRLPRLAWLMRATRFAKLWSRPLWGRRLPRPLLGRNWNWPTVWAKGLPASSTTPPCTRTRVRGRWRSNSSRAPSPATACRTARWPPASVPARTPT